MKNATIRKTEDGWHVELDFDRDFARHAIGGYSDIADDATLDEIVGRWFSLRVDGCDEDIEQAAEFHFDEDF